MRPSRCVTLVAMLAALAGAAHGQPTITNMGVLPTGAQADTLAVSANGSIAVGYCLIQPGGNRAVRWTGGVLTNIGAPASGDFSLATGVSANGTVVVGQSQSQFGPRAFRWVSPGPMVTLGNLAVTARGVSGDGQVVVGESGSNAYRWTSATGVVTLGTLPGHTGAVANAVNGDGSVVVGGSILAPGGLAYRWTSAGMVSLGLLPNATYSSAYGVNSDGTVVVGSSGTTLADARAFRWTQGVGIQDLGAIPGGSSCTAYDVSNDGEIVVGTCGTPAGARAFYWDSTIGPIDLNIYLTLLGTDLTGWVLERAAAISDDGEVIVGSGKFNGFSRGWIVRLDPDTDGDGLKDSWEINGIPYTDTGGATQRYMLPGANPMRKDLYVEVDAMAGLSLSHAAVDLVTAAFADASLLNPSGPSGVTLHVLHDDSALPYVSVWQTDGCWPLDFDDVREGFFGTIAERTDPNFMGILGAKAKAYRYCVIADNAAPNRIGGCGATPGDNFVLFMGTVLGVPDRQASAFMHELGHNLGLRHGGGDPTNGKPNYPSVMNYVLAYKYAWASSFWRLDYSRFGPTNLPNLNENSLNELTGIGSAGNFYNNFFMPYGVTVGPVGMTTRVVRYVRLDGSPTDFGAPTGTLRQDGIFSLSAIQDLNYAVVAPPSVRLPSVPSLGQSLTAFDDWGNVGLPTAASIGPAAPIPSFPQDELTAEGIEWIDQNFPSPAAPCYANCDGSTLAPLLNVNDFICFNNLYATGISIANCDASTIAPILNVNDFTCFLNRYSVGCS